MLRLWVRIVVSSSWFGPLPLIAGIRLIETNVSASFVLVGCGLGLTAAAFIMLLPARRRTGQDAQITQKERIPFAWGAQLSTFVLPFLAFRLSVSGDLLALAFVILLTITVFVRSGDFIANPLLALGGYSVYQVKFANETEAIVIVKGRPGLETRVVHVWSIQEGLYLGRWMDAGQANAQAGAG